MTDSIATFEVRIAPELEQFVRPLAEATRHPDNTRKHRIDKIAQSLRIHGQRAAIVVHAETGHIVKGNGTHEAAELLGWDRLAQIWQSMTDEEALGFLYADNRASDFSSYDRKKTIAGLQKLVDGPGLFDTLWEVEELEDLIEQEEGITVLEPQASSAALAVATEGGAPLSGEPKAPPERMKEIPLVMTVADHAVFVDQLKALARLYGTNGTIATIVEAVRRQSAMKGELPPDAEYAAKREVVVLLRDFIGQFPPDRSFTASWLMAQFEQMVPYRPPVANSEDTGQMALLADEPATVAYTIDDVRAIGEVTLAAAAAPVVAASAPPDEPEGDDAEALAALARFRASQPKP